MNFFLQVTIPATILVHRAVSVAKYDAAAALIKVSLSDAGQTRRHGHEHEHWNESLLLIDCQPHVLDRSSSHHCRDDTIPLDADAGPADRR